MDNLYTVENALNMGISEKQCLYFLMGVDKNMDKKRSYPQVIHKMWIMLRKPFFILLLFNT